VTGPGAVRPGPPSRPGPPRVAVPPHSGPARALTPSEREWLEVRSYLTEHRHALAVSAADSYPSSGRVAGTPLLAAPGWQPAAPVPLRDISLELTTAAAGPPGPSAGLVAPLLPERADGTRYLRYSDAMGELAAPLVFENRVTYRLAEADLAAQPPRLVFAGGRYFDGIDVGEAAAHEYAAGRLGLRPAGSLGTSGPLGSPEVLGSLGSSGSPRPPGPPGTFGSLGPPGPPGPLSLRGYVGDPCDLRRRRANLAISTLTLRLDRAAGRASFLLHWRDPAKVGHAGGLYQVVPVGVFQPSGEAAWNLRQDFSLWRCMIREFAEELCGRGEDYANQAGPVDYDSWPFARQLTEALDRGEVRVWCLGLGVDPLTYATDLLTVAAVDSTVFDALFTVHPQANAEGRVLAAREFAAHVVDRSLTREPIQAAGAAVLRLAWLHRDTLVS
jgi:hypothetical protein